MRRADKLNYTRLEPIEIINLSPLATASESRTSQATKLGPFCKSLYPLSFSFSFSLFTQKQSCARQEQMSGGGRVASWSFKINYVTAQHRWQQILNTCKSLLKHPTNQKERMIYFDIRYSHIFFFHAKWFFNNSFAAWETFTRGCLWWWVQQNMEVHNRFKLNALNSVANVA